MGRTITVRGGFVVKPRQHLRLEDLKIFGFPYKSLLSLLPPPNRQKNALLGRTDVTNKSLSNIDFSPGFNYSIISEQV